VSLDPREEVQRTANPDPIARLESKIADLERRLNAQRNRPTIDHGNGPPPGAPANSIFYVDDLTNVLYVGVAGAWRSVALT
jgi:hypothetical protein